MNFLNGITHLTNWMGNVIMPTVAGLFFALAVVRYARGYPHQYIAWAGLMCLMVSGLLRGLETFASQSAWNNPGHHLDYAARSRELDLQRVHARVDECSGFHPQFAQRLIHRVFESDGVMVWNGYNKLFLRQFAPTGTRPDTYLFRITPVDAGWLDRDCAWRCDAAQVVSFSEGNGQQEILIVLPPFGWVHGTQGTFCAEHAARSPMDGGAIARGEVRPA